MTTSQSSRPSNTRTRRRTVTTGLLASALLLACAAFPGPASASTSAQSSGSATAGNTYTLDGRSVSESEASTAGACAGIPDASGVVACFSSQRGLLKAQANAARNGETPVGWGYLPSDISPAATAARIEAEPSGSPAPNASAGVSPLSAGDNCAGYTN
jgi:hypothetical protein